MEKRIVRISSFAKKVLGYEKTGSVHSVYRKTINLRFGKQLISLQALDISLTPLSIIVDASEVDFMFFNIQAGNAVQVTSHGILVSGIRFYEKNTEIVNLKVNNQMIKQSKSFFQNRNKLLYDGILELLKEKEVLDLFFSKGRAVCRTPIALYAEKKINEFLNAIDNEAYERAVQKIVQMVGLGKGLTPSGDDFLCGMLAGITYCSNEQKVAELLSELKKYTAEAAKETNDISGAFLKCAVDGYHNEAIMKLPMQDNSTKIADLFSGIGHSSGADMLCGIYFAVEMIQFFSWL